MKSLGSPELAAGGLALSIVSTQEDLERLQRLRYRVFTEDMGAVFPEAEGDRDVDRFDAWCTHFMVRDVRSGQVVGTYRILTPAAAAQAGGYYADSEFDLRPLDDMRAQMVEVGRSCIAAGFRQGTAIMLLWSGLAQIMMHGRYRYMLGCASVSLRDGGIAAAQVWRQARILMDRHPDVPLVRPRRAYPMRHLRDAPGTVAPRIPPLIKGYLKLGATICGAPAWDPDFNTADFPVLLDMEWVDSRYRRHFGMDG